MARHMFAGASTPTGFVDFFGHIMPLDRAKRRYFLKGPSGSGKSTFMKKIAAGLESAGLDAEFFHCANDAASLDGLAVSARGFCVIDATAPHNRDPEIPAAIDRLIDFAAFVDERKIAGRLGEIKALIHKKRLLSEKAREMLSAAGSVYSAGRKPGEAGPARNSLRGISGNPGRRSADRKMFLSAVTPDGLISFASAALEGYEVHPADGPALAGLRDEANALGLDTESFYDPLAPASLEYLLLPESKTAFAAGGGPRGELFEKILESAVRLMKESRAAHAGIEEIYISAMDFERVNAATERTLAEALGFG